MSTKNKDVSINICEKIRNIRKIKDLSQKDFAEIGGVHTNTAQNYETNKAPSFEFLLALIKKLNVNPLYFFQDDVPVFTDMKITYGSSASVGLNHDQNLQDLIDLQREKIKQLEQQLKKDRK